MIATNFNKDNVENEIVDEYNRYRILDLVSGMNAFIQYGKADMIKKYCNDLNIPKGSNVDKLVESMADIDYAISVCNVVDLKKIIGELKDALNIKGTSNNDFVNNIFQILKDGIEKDYGNLVMGEGHGTDYSLDYLELISWCGRKGFIQQALTLIEDKMPEIYIIDEETSTSHMNTVLSYKFVDPNNKTEYLEALGPKYEKNEQRKIFYHTTMDWNTKWEWKKNKELEELKKLAENEEKEAKIIKYSLQKLCDGEDKKEGEAKKIKDPLGKLVDEINIKMEKKKEDEFIVSYCKFRRLEDMISRDDVKSYKSDYGSILKWCKGLGKKQFKVKTKPEPIYAELQINMHKKIEKNPVQQDYLDKTLLLHSALKKERNCCNHASETGIRLSAEVVKHAIEIYTKRVKNVLEFINA